MSAEVRVLIQVDATGLEFEQEHSISDYRGSSSNGTDAARRMLADLTAQARAALDLLDAQAAERRRVQ